jgi:hypothetical protein
MRKRFLGILLFVMLLMPALTAYASAEERQEPPIVTITYDQALQLALTDTLTAFDIAIQIHGLQMHHRDLRHEISRGIQDPINVLANEMWQLDSQMWAMFAMRSELNAAIPYLDGSELIEALVGLQGIDVGIAGLQAHQNALQTEMNRLHNERPIQDPALAARNDLNDMERQMESLRLHQDEAELWVELALRSLIIEIQEMALQIEILEAELELGAGHILRLTLAHELGFISRHDLRTAEHSQNLGIISLDELRRAEVTLHQNLNYLIRQPLTQNTAIKFERQLPEIPENLDRHIAQIVPQTHAIRQLQLDLDSAIGARYAYTRNTGNITITAQDRNRAINYAGNSREITTLRQRIALQDAVDRATLALNQATRTMTATIHRAYLSLEALTAQEAILQTELHQAQATLKATTINYELGYITWLELEEANLAIQRIEQSIQKTLNQKWALAFMLKNPTLLQ